MANYEILSPNKYDGSGGYKKSIVVVHTSEPGAYVKGKNPGTAEGLGNYLKSSSVKASYHVAVDRDGNTCRMVADNNRAWHAGNIGNNEGYSICAVGWSAWSREEWLSMPKMLDSMAVQVAAWCKKEGIPAQYVAPANLVKDVWGITGHGDVAKAWRETDHTDPGNGFPYDVLISKVNAILKPIPKETAIQAKRRTSSWLGDPVTTQEELPTPDGVGRYRYYTNGAIYQKIGFPSYAMSNEMVEKYKEIGYEASLAGYPKSDVFDLPDSVGRAQVFEGCSFYYYPNLGVKLIFGRIGAKWAEYEWERGILGYPESDPYTPSTGVGQVQKFHKSMILWTEKTDAHPVYGLIYEAYERNGFETDLGFPTSDESDTQDGKGRYQATEFGHLYWRRGAERAFAIDEIFMRVYKKLGFEVGVLGYPAGDRKDIDHNKSYQAFENGRVDIDHSTGKVTITVDGRAFEI